MARHQDLPEDISCELLRLMREVAAIRYRIETISRMKDKRLTKDRIRLLDNMAEYASWMVRGLRILALNPRQPGE